MISKLKPNLTNEKAIVTSIESFPEKNNVCSVSAGMTAGITLSERIFVERGHIASHQNSLPMLTNVFSASIFWLSEKPLAVGNSYSIRYGTVESKVTVQSIDKMVDTESLITDDNAKNVIKNNVAEVTFRSRDILAIDSHHDNFKLGRAVIYDGHNVVGGGLINMDGHEDQRQNQNQKPKSENIYKVNHSVTPEMRAERFGHYGGVFWFTGLSGSGKSTLAVAVEERKISAVLVRLLHFRPILA